MDFSAAFEAWLQTVVVVPLPSGVMANRWDDTYEVESRGWTCAYCDRDVASNRGWRGVAGNSPMFVRICHLCSKPTFFPVSGQPVPQALPGSKVDSLPKDIETLYGEVRQAMSAGANTAAVLTCRKILMHVAAQNNGGAPPGNTFQQCVDWLDTQGYIPRGAKSWVDHIRKKGNEATHDIVVMAPAEANLILKLVEQLLRNVYELPKLPQP